MIGYARVFTEQQEREAQLPELRTAGCKRIYEETIGGGTMDRPELENCLERLEKGDTLVVWRLDRLGRSIRNLLQIVDRLDKGQTTRDALPVWEGEDARRVTSHV